MKLKWTTWRKSLLVIPYVLLFSLSDIFLANRSDSFLDEKLWYSICGRITSGNLQALILSTEILGTVFLFGILFANYLPRFFENSSIIFTRIENRRKWAVKRIADLFIAAITYSTAYFFIKLLIAVNQVNEVRFGQHAAMVIIVLLNTLFTIYSVIGLLINLIALRYGTHIGFSVSVAVVLALEVIAILFFDNSSNMLFNPFCLNPAVATSLQMAIEKVIIEWIYLFTLSTVLTFHIDKMDLF